MTSVNQMLTTLALSVALGAADQYEMRHIGVTPLPRSSKNTGAARIKRQSKKRRNRK